jgi:chromosome segregation ATPase
MEEDPLERLRAALVAQATERDIARRQLDELRAQLAESHARLDDLQEQFDRVVGQARQAEGLRDELEGIRSENDRLRTEVQELRGRVTDAAHLEGVLRAALQATRAQVGRIDLRRLEGTAQELDDVRVERDRLLAELQRKEEDRLRLAVLANELEMIRADRDRLDTALQSSVAREERLQARLHEVERQAGEEQTRAEDWGRALQEQLDAARLQLERDLPPLRQAAERLRLEVDALVRERDAAHRQIDALGAERDRLAVLFEQAEAVGRDAARHEAEVKRLGRTIEQDRDELAAMARRDEELTEQARALRTELDRLQHDRGEEGREHARTQEALWHDLESALADATATSERAAAADAARAELEDRLAELEDRLRAANDRAQRLEAEIQARGDQIAELRSERGPGRPPSDADREVDRLRIEELAADLDEARAANGRLRALLDVFGLSDYLGPGAALAPRASAALGTGRGTGPAVGPHASQ